jgi:uncharacterized membrane protein
MNRSVKLLGLFVGAAVIGHVALIFAVPHVLMRVAMGRISDGGQATNVFQFGERTTEKSRRVVRPSPDLAYATCVFDLSGGPLVVSAAPSPGQGYVSLSVFAANTDNIAALDSSQYPGGIRFVLAKKDQAVPGGLAIITSPSNKGIILDRRLAPNAQTFAAVDQARRADRCETLPK